MSTRVTRVAPAAILAALLFQVPAPAPAALPDGFADQAVVSGLTQPVGMAFLPDGRILVAEQTIRAVRLVVAGALQPGAVLTIPDVNTSGGERGLLGIAVDPGWPGRPYLYAHFTRTPGSVIYLARFTATGDLGDPGSGNLSFGDRYDIVTDLPDAASNHNGGTVVFGPDGMLYASVGDDADNCAAQDSTSLHGVVLRLDVSGLPSGPGGPPSRAAITPADNPFAGGDANAGLVFAFGLRNPFRVTVDPLLGRLVIGDVGQDAYEELDIATGGENFGWPFREGVTERLPGGCTEPGGAGTQNYVAPIVWYAQAPGAQSIIGGPAYRLLASPTGDRRFPPPYDGAVFYAEYYSGWVRVLREDGGTWTPLAASGQPNATDWGTGYAFVSQWVQGPDGALYYVRQAGEIRRIAFTGVPGGLPDEPLPPLRLRAVPNPVRAAAASLRIDAELARAGSIEVSVLDARGALRRTVVREDRPAGAVAIPWDGRDDAGRRLPPGVYFVRFRHPGGAETTRVTLLP